MADRIATFSTTAGLLSQAMGLQAKYSTTQLQSSSGLKSEYFSGVSADAGRMLNLQSQFTAINSQVSAIKSASTRLNSIQDVTTSVSDLLDTINSQLTISLDGTVTSSASTVLGNQAGSWLEQMAGLMNTQYAGSYLFGGTAQDSPPVNLSDTDYTPLVDPTVTDTGYYQGNNVTQSVRASSSLRVDYGVTADNPAFEQVFRALKMIQSNPGDRDTLNAAFTLIKSASTSVADITATLSSKGNILAKEQATQEASLDTISNSISDVRDVDITATAVKLTVIETQLQASYTTLTTLLKLNLSTYLR